MSVLELNMSNLQPCLARPLDWSGKTVFSNSPAEGELQRGDVLVSINNKDANTLTHKNAQDIIKFGGGQLELIVNRPPPGSTPVQVHVIKPNQPHAPTIRKIQQQPRATVKQEFRPKPIQFQPVSAPQSQMPPPRSVGHHPKTIRQIGGGGPSFGSEFGKSPGQQYASTPSRRPVEGPGMMNRVQESLDTIVYSPQTEQYLGQSPFETPVAAEPYTPGPPPEPEDEDYEFIPVHERKKAFFEPQTSRPGKQQGEDPDEEYEYGGVSDRLALFNRLNRQARPTHSFRPSQKKVIKSVKAPRPMGKMAGPTFGTDYKMESSAPRPTPQQHRAPRPTPINVQAQPVQTWQPNAEIDTSGGDWSGSLRSSGPKPWEIDMQYQEQPGISQSTYEQPKRKPKKPRSVSYQDMPKKQPQVFSPTKTPAIEFSGGDQDGPRVVHLQYNSPMGMYSRNNIQETLSGQIAGIAEEAPPAPAPAPVTPGARDWNQSAVYRMLQDEGPPPKPAGYGLAPKSSTVQVQLQQPKQQQHKQQAQPPQKPQPAQRIQHIQQPRQQPMRPDIDDEVGVSEF